MKDTLRLICAIAIGGTIAVYCAAWLVHLTPMPQADRGEAREMVRAER